MENRDVIERAIQLLQHLKSRLQASHLTHPATPRLLDIVNGTLSKIQSSSDIDHPFLMALEKGYQGLSMILGLTGMPLDEGAHLAWDQFDSFMQEVIKPRLHLYGFYWRA